MSLSSRIAERQREQPCIAIASNGDRCLRTDPHGPEDRHQRGAHTWGSRDVPQGPRWLANLQARDLSGYGQPL